MLTYLLGRGVRLPIYFFIDCLLLPAALLLRGEARAAYYAAQHWFG